MAFVYLLRCADGTYYTGWTSDLARRVDAHNSKRGAKYTRARLPVHLVYFEEYESKSDAMKREYALRILPHREKECLVTAFDPSRLVLSR